MRVSSNKAASERAEYVNVRIENVVNMAPDDNHFLSRAFLNTVVCESPASIRVNLNFPSDNEGYGDYFIEIRDCHNKAHLHGEFHDGTLRGTENFFHKVNTIIAHLMAAKAFVAKRMKNIHHSKSPALAKKKRGTSVRVLDRGGRSRLVSLNHDPQPVCAPPPPLDFCNEGVAHTPHDY